MRYARTFFVFVLLFCIFEVVRLWFLSPDVMAVHFNVQGDPDRFVPKAQFFWFQIQTALTVIGIGLVPQVLFLFLPVGLINIPNRDYWLVPERRDETVDRLSSFAAMVFGVILLVIQAGFELSAYANLQNPIFFNAQLMLPIMFGSFIVIGVMIFWLAMSFRIPAAKD